jgi:hypothetical protein
LPTTQTCRRKRNARVSPPCRLHRRGRRAPRPADAPAQAASAARNLRRRVRQPRPPRSQTGRLVFAWRLISRETADHDYDVALTADGIWADRSHVRGRTYCPGATITARIRGFPILQALVLTIPLRIRGIRDGHPKQSTFMKPDPDDLQEEDMCPALLFRCGQVLHHATDACPFRRRNPVKTTSGVLESAAKP